MSQSVARSPGFCLILLLAGCTPKPAQVACPTGSVRVQDGSCVGSAMYQYAQCIFGLAQARGAPVPSNHIDYCYSLATGVAVPPRSEPAPMRVPANATMATPAGLVPTPLAAKRCEIPVDFRAVPAGASVKGACAGLTPHGTAAVRVRGTNVATAAQILARRVEWQLEAQGHTARSQESDQGSAEVDLALSKLTIPSNGVITAELRLEFCPGTPGITATCGLAGGTLLIEEIDPMEGVQRRTPPRPGRPVRDSL